MPFEHDVYCCLVPALMSVFVCSGGVGPQLHACNLDFVSKDPDLLFCVSRLTTGHVQLVGQERSQQVCPVEHFQESREGCERLGVVKEEGCLSSLMSVILGSFGYYLVGDGLLL